MRAPTMYSVVIEADGKWSATAGHPYYRGSLAEGDEPIKAEGCDGPREALDAVMAKTHEVMLKEAEGLEAER